MFRLGSSMLSADFSQTDFLSAGVGVGWGGGKLHPLTGRLCLQRGGEGANLEMRVPLQCSDACPWGSHLALPASYGDWETPRWSPARDSPAGPDSTLPVQRAWVCALVRELTPRRTARSSGRLKVPCAAAEAQSSQRHR